VDDFDLDDTYEDYTEELESTRELYFENGIYFVQNLPSTLKRLTTSACTFDNLIKGLSGSRVKPTFLKLLQNNEGTDIFKNAKQLEYFKTQESWRFLNLHIHSSIQSQIVDTISSSVIHL
jgi:hypothetical protein